MATGLLPFWQNRQCFLPAISPVTFSGWNGPGTGSFTCGPDLTASAANTAPASNAKLADSTQRSGASSYASFS